MHNSKYKKKLSITIVEKTHEIILYYLLKYTKMYIVFARFSDDFLNIILQVNGLKESRTNTDT